LEKNPKDYLHLYTGCECHCFEEGLLAATGTIVSVYKDYDEVKDKDSSWPVKVYNIPIGLRFSRNTIYHFNMVKPLVRPLSSITEEEAFEFSQIIGGASHLSRESQISQVKYLLTAKWNAQTNISGAIWVLAFKFLLEKRFDLFGLIEAGLAIDKTTLIPKENATN
jgi:hypothetical protein